MPAIVITEDNINIRRELVTFFESRGYTALGISRFENPAQVAEDVCQAGPDILVLDIGLGEISGFDVCREIRKRGNFPILFVTARDREEDELMAYRLGGDDFIRKPYRLPVLLAKTERMLERAGEAREAVTLGDVTLHLVQNRISRGGESLELSGNEMKMLYFLFSRKGETVSRDALLEYLWENKLFVDENILNVNLSRLRKKLRNAGMEGLIETVPGQGLRISRKEGRNQEGEKR